MSVPSYPGILSSKKESTHLEREDHLGMAHALVDAIRQRDRRIEDLERALIQERARTREEPVPDMFWNDGNPHEVASSSIFALVDEEWANGVVVIGDTLTIQQAVSLPTIKVRVVKGSEPYTVDYEVVEETETTEVPA